MFERAFETYSVGIATGDITPDIGTPLSGFAARGLHTSTGIYHPLRTVAVVIDDGATPVIILSAEIIFFESIAESVRISISQATGIPTAAIILSGTHTHCGPSVRTENIERHGWIEHNYVQHAIMVMTKAAHTAWQHRFPAKLSFITGRCDLAVSRRLPDPANPGRMQWGPYPQGASDHEVSILTVESLDGIMKGILFSYACHPTSRGGLLVGGDYPGFAYDRIQEVFDFAQPCFLQGCGADQKPRPADPNARTFSGRSIEETRGIGFDLGNAVITAVQEGVRKPVTGKITMRRAVINLRTEPLDGNLLAESMREAAPEFKKRWARYHKERVDAGLPEEREVPFEIQTLSFGYSLAVVTLAAEAVVEHALRLKRDLRPQFTNVLPLGYCNDVIGYVPVKRQFNEWGYEVIDANQYRRRTGRFVEETEDHIHGTIKMLLKGEKIS